MRPKQVDRVGTRQLGRGRLTAGPPGSFPRLLLATLLGATPCHWLRSEDQAGGQVASQAVTEASDPLPVAPPAAVPPGVSFVVVAAGDIAGRQYAQLHTAALLGALSRGRALAAVLPLGDLQYPRGEYHGFLADYDPSWGRWKEITRPVPGNHEYALGHSNADGYFDYFNGPGAAHGIAGERGRGYYSFDVGDWHFIALNTSDGCRKVACAPGSAMFSWLLRDLRRAGGGCTLAYWHHPRFQSGDVHEDSPFVAPLWDALYDAGADVALAGHDHNFQQLAPLDKQGRVDRSRGIRSFVVGTGGARAYPWFEEDLHADAVEARVAGHYGVLELTLGPGSYRWRFVAAGGPEGEVLASGSDVCH